MLPFKTVYLWAYLVFSILWLNSSVRSNFYFSSEIQFNGNQNISELSDDKETIKIGLIISKKDKTGMMAVRGAEMALLEENESAANKGKHFQLVVRDCEGPWGRTSKEVASLIYDDEVCVIMASLDGRNGHLAEQVATKSHISLVSTRATDPTLSQAFVPWYFRCIPNDRQQARILYEDIYIKSSYRKVGVLRTDKYDDRIAADEFVKYSTSQGFPSPRSFIVDATKSDYHEVMKEIEKSGLEVIVLFMEAEISEKISEQIARSGFPLIVYKNISTLNSIESYQENTRFVSPASWYKETANNFRKRYNDNFNEEPGLVAAYAFDGMNVIIKAIKIVGREREAIKIELANTELDNGVTGSIQFDEFGNRKELPVIMKIQYGKPVLVD